MRTTLIAFGIFLSTSLAFAQDKESSDAPSFALQLGGSYSNFSLDDVFKDFYPHAAQAVGAFVDIGTTKEMLLVQYYQFKVNGTTRVVNAGAKGVSSWKQQFGLVGLRYRPVKSIIYFDAGYALTQATEEIGTIDPVVPDLASSQTIKDRGPVFGLGIAPRLFSPLDIFVEAKYFWMMKNEKLPDGKSIPNIGGWMLSAGIQLNLE